MSYSVTVDSQISVVDDLSINKQQYVLPQTQFTAISPVQNVINFATLVASNTTWTYNLSSIGSQLLVLAIKMSRPSVVALVTASQTYTIMPSTYVNLVVNTNENLLTTVTSLQVIVPPTPSSAPTPAPSNYPDCIVELFALVQASIS